MQMCTWLFKRIQARIPGGGQDQGAAMSIAIAANRLAEGLTRPSPQGHWCKALHEDYMAQLLLPFSSPINPCQCAAGQPFRVATSPLTVQPRARCSPTSTHSVTPATAHMAALQLPSLSTEQPPRGWPRHCQVESLSLWPGVDKVWLGSCPAEATEPLQGRMWGSPPFLPPP